MIKQKQKKGIKEWFRKRIVALKKRPHTIPLVAIAITFMVYSFNLTTVSNTTARINITPMGLCSFITMLCSILMIVAFLNAFPKRQKPKLFMCIVLGVLIAATIAADIVYLNCIEQGFANHEPFRSEPTLLSCRSWIIAHLICLGVTALLIVSIPLLGKAFGKINTSVDLGETKEMDVIELEDE